MMQLCWPEQAVCSSGTVQPDGDSCQNLARFVPAYIEIDLNSTTINPNLS